MEAQFTIMPPQISPDRYTPEQAAIVNKLEVRNELAFVFMSFETRFIIPGTTVKEVDAFMIENSLPPEALHRPDKDHRFAVAHTRTLDNGDVILRHKILCFKTADEAGEFLAKNHEIKIVDQMVESLRALDPEGFTRDKVVEYRPIARLIGELAERFGQEYIDPQCHAVYFQHRMREMYAEANQDGDE